MPSRTILSPSAALLVLALATTVTGRAFSQEVSWSDLVAGAVSKTSQPPTLRFESHDGEGRLLTARVPGETGSRAVLQSVRAALAERLGGPVSLLSAFSSGDQELQVTFAQMKAGVRGLILISKDAEGFAVEVVMDRADRAARTLGDLAARLPGHGAGAAKPMALRTVSISDGSASVRIPEGWTATGVNGMVDVLGPGGQACSFGIHFQVATPETAAYQRQMLVQMGMPPAAIEQNLPITAPLRGPVQAFADVMPQIGRRCGFEMSGLRILETQQMRDMAGPSAYILAEARVTDDRGTRMMKSLSHVYASPLAGGQWLYYSSSVAAPSEVFDRDLATMVACWDTFQVSGQELRRRHESALKSMKETFALYESARKNAEESQDRGHAAMDHVLRGTWPVDDLEEGKRYDAWTSDPKTIVDGLNEIEGYKRWRVVPMSDL